MGFEKIKKNANVEHVAIVAQLNYKAKLKTLINIFCHSVKALVHHLKEYGKPHQKDHYLSYQILIYQMVMISKINKLLKQNLFKDFPYLQIHY